MILSRGALRKFLIAFVMGCLVVRQRQTTSIFGLTEESRVVVPIVDNQNAYNFSSSTRSTHTISSADKIIPTETAAQQIKTLEAILNKTTTTTTANNQHHQQHNSTLDVFPHFIQDYIEFHRQQRTQFGTARYLIWRCDPNSGSCGGTGDRIKGIMSAFYTALCSRRVLLIDWPLSEAPFDVSPFLTPHYVDWRIPDPLKLAARQAPVYSAIDSYAHPFFKELQIPSRFLQTKMIDMRANLWSEHVNAAVHVNNTQCVQRLWQQEATAQQPTVQQPKVPLSSQNKALFRLGFWCLFTFSDAVHDRKRNMQTRTGLLESKPEEEEKSVPEKVASESINDDKNKQPVVRRRLLQEQRLQQRREQKPISNHRRRKLQTVPSSLSSASTNASSPLAGQTTMQPYIAVHIRTGMVWKDPPRHNSMEHYQQFYQCAKKLQQGIYRRQRQTRTPTAACSTAFQYEYGYQRVLPPLPIYVAADNVVAKTAMVQLEQQEQAAITTNATGSSFSSIRILPEMQIFHIDKSRGMMGNEQEKTVWGELNVLLEATCLVASRSGFSDLAAWLQPAHQNGKRCAILYSKCDDEAQVQQALDALEFPNAAC